MNSKISYEKVGKGQPIIFIHGVGSRKNSWENIINILKQRYECISYDLRGHGKSPLPDKNKFYLEDLVNDLENLRSKLYLNKIHLIGHSLGGQIGPAYVRKFPNNAISLTMLSTAAFRTNSEKQKTLNLINDIRNIGLDAVVPKLINRWYTDEFAEKNPNLILKRIKMIKEMNMETFCRVFWIYATCTMEEWLNEINIPTLLITGENDLACNPKINMKMAEAIKNSKLEILPKYKHSITSEAGEIVGIKIKEFLDKL